MDKDLQADLLAWSAHWDLAADAVLCGRCGQPQLVRDRAQPFAHAAGCPNTDLHPWQTLASTLAPLAGEGDARPAEVAEEIPDRILALLRGADEPIPSEKIRLALSVRIQVLGAALTALRRGGKVKLVDNRGWMLTGGER